MTIYVFPPFSLAYSGGISGGIFFAHPYLLLIFPGKSDILYIMGIKYIKAKYVDFLRGNILCAE